MKKQLINLLGLGVIFASMAATAQTVNMKANIPFSFVVNGPALPSGEYKIEGLGVTGSAISIRNLDGKGNGLVLAQPCEAGATSTRSKLVFHRYGNRYFLAKIWLAGSKSGREIPTSRNEVELAKATAPENVVLLAELQ